MQLRVTLNLYVILLPPPPERSVLWYWGLNPGFYVKQANFPALLLVSPKPKEPGKHGAEHLES